MKKFLLILTALVLGLTTSQAQKSYKLDPAKSVIQIHLDTAGGLGFMGHPHLIEASIERGTFVYDAKDTGKSSVELEVAAGALKVMDPKASEKDRKEIQATMESDRVLDVKKYPKILFKSVKITSVESNRLSVEGNLTIRDQTHPVTVRATLESGGPPIKISGETQFKQTTYGIKPVSAAGGTVRVQDEMKLTFQVITGP